MLKRKPLTREELNARNRKIIREYALLKVAELAQKYGVTNQRISQIIADAEKGGEVDYSKLKVSRRKKGAEKMVRISRSKAKPKIPCKFCGKKISPSTTRTKYCSVECYSKDVRRSEIHVPCFNCGKPVRTKVGPAKKRRFCNRACFKSWVSKRDTLAEWYKQDQKSRDYLEIMTELIKEAKNRTISAKN